VRTGASWAHPRRSLPGHRYCYSQKLGAQTELGASDRFQVDGESNVIVDSLELNHPALPKKIGSIAHRQNRLTAERSQIGFEATAFRGADVSDCAPARLRGRFQPRHADRLAIQPFIRCQVIQRMPKGILAHDADIETLAIVHCIGRRESNEFSKIKEIRRLYCIFRHPALSVCEGNNHAECCDRSKQSSPGYTIPQAPPQGWAVKSAGLGQARSHLSRVFVLTAPNRSGMRIFESADVRE